MTRTVHGIFGLAVVLLSGVGMAQAAGPDPRGKPAGMEPGQPLRWYVWHDGDGWHVRTTTKSMPHEFVGTIHVVGGKITSISAAKLEAKGAVKDWWTLSEGDKVLKLDLKTKGGMDGFDFQVGPRANQIEFTLKIDGKDLPAHIYVGKDATHPAAAKFLLPAHPGKK